MNRQRIWQVFALLVGVAAGAATRAALTRIWRAAGHREPPGNPADRDTPWVAAITWSVASGAALAVARLVAQRGAAEAWKTATGDYPEGLDELRP
jgi:hypothetical protein